jgi:3-phenylpropionate/trans-cinnamate dioxygenase ferredoxin component
MSDLVRLCSVGDVASGEARRFDVGSLRVALVRIGDDWYAIGDRCTHQDVSLAEGEVHAETLELECWKHGSCFSLTSGEPSSLPATRPVPTYEVRIDGDDVLIREVSSDG